MQTEKKHKALNKPERYWRPTPGQFVCGNGHFGTFVRFERTTTHFGSLKFLSIIQGEDGKEFSVETVFVNPAI
jgi:hypothetical protein